MPDTKLIWPKIFDDFQSFIYVVKYRFRYFGTLSKFICTTNRILKFSGFARLICSRKYYFYISYQTASALKTVML